MKSLKHILTGMLLFAVTVCMLGKPAAATLIHNPKAEAKHTGYSIATGNPKIKVGGNIKNVKAKQAYKKKLKELSNDDLSYSYDYWEFALIDLNKDGVLEMATTHDKEYHLTIWAYVNGKAKAVGEGFSGEQKYYPNKKLYYSTVGHGGNVYIEYYRFNGQKMIKLAHIEGTIEEKEAYTYYIGKKKVSKNKWRKYEKQLKKGAKEEKLKYHKNTSSNRKKYLA